MAGQQITAEVKVFWNGWVDAIITAAVTTPGIAIMGEVVRSPELEQTLTQECMQLKYQHSWVPLLRNYSY